MLNATEEERRELHGRNGKASAPFLAGTRGPGAEAVVDTIRWGAGAESLLTRTKDNARLPQGQCGACVALTWACWLLVDPAPR